MWDADGFEEFDNNNDDNDDSRKSRLGLVNMQDVEAATSVAVRHACGVLASVQGLTLMEAPLVSRSRPYQILPCCNPKAPASYAVSNSLYAG